MLQEAIYKYTQICSNKLTLELANFLGTTNSVDFNVGITMIHQLTSMKFLVGDIA